MLPDFYYCYFDENTYLNTYFRYRPGWLCPKEKRVVLPTRFSQKQKQLHTFFDSASVAIIARGRATFFSKTKISLPEARVEVNPVRIKKRQGDFLGIAFHSQTSTASLA